MRAGESPKAELKGVLHPRVRGDVRPQGGHKVAQGEATPCTLLGPLSRLERDSTSWKRLGFTLAAAPGAEIASGCRPTSQTGRSRAWQAELTVLSPARWHLLRALRFFRKGCGNFLP